MAEMEDFQKLIAEEIKKNNEKINKEIKSCQKEISGLKREVQKRVAIWKIEKKRLCERIWRLENRNRLEYRTSGDIIYISDSDDEEQSNKMPKKIKCICLLNEEFSHIDLVTCSGCSCKQHAVCIGYLYAKDATDNYICQTCKFDKNLTPTQINLELENALYRLILGYAYFSNEFPEEVLVKLTSELQTTIKEKLKSVTIISENDGKFSVDVQLIEKVFLKEWFPLSFIETNELLPDSINLMEPNSQEDSLIVEEPSQKKIKHV